MKLGPGHEMECPKCGTVYPQKPGDHGHIDDLPTDTSQLHALIHELNRRLVLATTELRTLTAARGGDFEGDYIGPLPDERAVLKKHAAIEAEAAFRKAESEWLRLGPIHGPDRLEPALIAYVRAAVVTTSVDASGGAIALNTMKLDFETNPLGDCMIDYGHIADVWLPDGTYCAGRFISPLGLVNELRDALRLILPLAKGYAAKNRVGSNAAYVLCAEELLAKLATTDSAHG